MGEWEMGGWGDGVYKGNRGNRGNSGWKIIWQFIHYFLSRFLTISCPVLQRRVGEMGRWGDGEMGGWGDEDVMEMREIGGWGIMGFWKGTD